MSETCRSCGASYAAAGDGFDGECGNCADRREEDDFLSEVEVDMTGVELGAGEEREFMQEEDR